MPAPINIIGKRFNHLVVIREVERHIFPTGRKARRYLVQCDCGDEIAVLGMHITSGHTKSCDGPSHLGGKRDRHGESADKKLRAAPTPEYQCWMNMIQRCENENRDNYAYYGGRGVEVCPRWRGSYELFLVDMGRRPSPHHSIERIDNDGNYEPGNCRWATQIEQSANRRDSRLIEFKGESKTFAEWAAGAAVNANTLRKRILLYGWPMDRARSTPSRIKRP